LTNHLLSENAFQSPILTIHSYKIIKIVLI